jgi:hypothetical protein
MRDALAEMRNLSIEILLDRIIAQSRFMICDPRSAGNT